MAVSKVILNGTTLIDVTDDTVNASNLLSGETATRNDGVEVTGTYTPVEPATASPLMDGTAAVGSSTKYAREDHVHPTDTSRQATLVSGTNIKTINNESILGSGNITVQGGGGADIVFSCNGTVTAANITVESGSAQNVLTKLNNEEDVNAVLYFPNTDSYP